MAPIELRDILTVLALVATIVLGLLTFRNGRRGVQISQQTLEMNRMQQLERRTTELDQKLSSTVAELAKANEQVNTLQRRLRVTTEMADQATAEWHSVVKMIWRPGMTLERVREYVGPVGQIDGEEGGG